MAEFSLNIKTECTQELLDIVTRINGAQTKPYNPAVTAELLEAAQAAPAAIPERDAHGIKYDERIHPGRDSASLFKGDNTWRKRRGVADDQYEEIYLELAREARAAGLYTGPAIPELELESRVGPFYWVNESEGCFGLEETLDELNEKLASDSGAVEIDEARYTKISEEFADALSEQAPIEPMPVPTTAPAPAPVAPAPAPAAPAPAPAPTPAPASGMSAESVPDMVKTLQRLVTLVGGDPATALVRAFGVKAVPECTPQHLRDMAAITEKVAATLKPEDKAEHGRSTLATVALEFGYIVQ